MSVAGRKLETGGRQRQEELHICIRSWSLVCSYVELYHSNFEQDTLSKVKREYQIKITGDMIESC